MEGKRGRLLHYSAMGRTAAILIGMSHSRSLARLTVVAVAVTGLVGTGASHEVTAHVRP